MAHDAPELAFGGEHPRGRPAERHVARSLALHTHRVVAHDLHHRLPRVRRLEGAQQRARDPQPGEGERLSEALVERRGAPGRRWTRLWARLVIPKAPRERLEEALRAGRVGLRPGRPAATRDEQALDLGQPSQDVALLVAAAATDQDARAQQRPEAGADGLAAVDDGRM